MTQENYNVIGVMSGTSLDGTDVAHLTFKHHNGQWQFDILESETVGYDPSWVDRLKNAVQLDEEGLRQINTDYTKLLAATIKDFISRNAVSAIDAVCSHGHTILHQPQNGITLQIGNLPEIAKLTNQTVVCDFRVGDVKLGGQGAPLVPIGDRILFPDYDYCLNLGGFSNVSFEENGVRIAFDISAVNTVLNFYANILGTDYDDQGAIAASGNLNKGLLDELNAMQYYSMPYPKSLGFESVKHIILPLIENYDIPIENKLRTFSEHIAIQIAAALPEKSGKMLITGGGAYNDFLIARINDQLPQIEIVIPDRKILEYKEALIFGLLGVLKLRNENNVLSSVTGAAHDHSSGVIYRNQN